MTINLPTPESTKGKASFAQIYSNDKVLKEKVEELEAKVASTAHPVTYYEPKVIATEQTRESTSFGTLSTADEISGVVVPTNGILLVRWCGLVKSSVEAAGRIALFVGSNAAYGITTVNEFIAPNGTGSTNFHYTTTSAGSNALFVTGVETSGPITTVGLAVPGAELFAAAGTYAVAVKFRATSGSITAKERKLWVEVHGT